MGHQIDFNKEYDTLGGMAMRLAWAGNVHLEYPPEVHRHQQQERTTIMSSIEERVAKIIVEQLGVKPEEIKPEASFVEDLGADSLDTVELVMALEEEFETEIPDEEAEKISTVQSAVDYIKAHG